MTVSKTFTDLDSDFVRRILPHREPMLLVDSVKSLTLKKSVHAVRTFHGDEPWFQGHFPDNPILPGVIILEAMAQAGGFLFIPALTDELTSVGGYVIGFQNVKFKQFVHPGDEVHLYGGLEVKMMPLARAKFQAKVDEQIVAQAEVSYMMLPI